MKKELEPNNEYINPGCVARANFIGITGDCSREPVKSIDVDGVSIAVCVNHLEVLKTLLRQD